MLGEEKRRDDGDGNTGRNQWLRARRAGIHPLRGAARRYRGGGDQRPRGRAHAGAPASVRLHLRRVGPPGGGQGELAAVRRAAGTGAQRARSRGHRLGAPRRGRGHRVDRQVPRPGAGRGAPEGRREEGHHLRAGQAGRHHRGDGRQRPGLRPRGARRDLERLVHHQLRGSDGEGAARRVRRRAGVHDDHPRLHRGPDAPRRAAQGPAPRPVRCLLHRPDEHRRGEGNRPGHPGHAPAGWTGWRSASRSRTGR